MVTFRESSLSMVMSHIASVAGASVTLPDVPMPVEFELPVANMSAPKPSSVDAAFVGPATIWSERELAVVVEKVMRSDVSLVFVIESAVSLPAIPGVALIAALMSFTRSPTDLLSVVSEALIVRLRETASSKMNVNVAFEPSFPSQRFSERSPFSASL